VQSHNAPGDTTSVPGVIATILGVDDPSAGRDWVLTIATIALAGVTLGLVLATLKLAKTSTDAFAVANDALALDRERWAAEVERQRRADANDCEVFLNVGSSGDDERPMVGLRIVNGSRHAIRHVEFHAVRITARFESQPTRYVSSGREASEWWEITGVNDVGDLRDVRAFVTFKDSDGCWWKKSHDGELSLYDDNLATLFGPITGATPYPAPDEPFDPAEYSNTQFPR